MRGSVFFFCIALGFATFFLLANLSVSSNGYDCGSVMSTRTYEGRSAEDFDPTGELGSSFSDAAAAANGAKADDQNSACSDSIESRQKLAIGAGLIVAILSLGGVRLFSDADQPQVG